MSKIFLKYLKDQGGLSAVLQYLEFLCTECCETKEAATHFPAEDQTTPDAQLIEKWEQFHTELGCLYVQSIKRHLQKYLNPTTAEIDIAKADKSSTVLDMRKKLRNFLERSDLYIAPEILELLPQDYLNNERAILHARSGSYREAFDLCIVTLGDISFAKKVAKFAVKWRPDDKKIYTNLHASLHDNNHMDEARQILDEYNKQIDFIEVTKCINDDDLMDEQLFEIYQRAFTQIEK